MSKITQEPESKVDDEYKDNQDSSDNHEVKLTDEEIKLCAYSYKERLLYYIVYPRYFFEKLWESITTLKWKF